MRYDTHISDRDLLLAADGELSERRLAQVQAHRETCLLCRTRAREIENALADFATMQRSSQNAPGGGGGARARLRVQLNALASQPAAPALSFPPYAWAGVGIAAVLVMLAGLALLPRFLDRTQEASGVVPNKRLTPGSILSTSESSVCGTPGESGARIIPAAMVQRVFKEYGIRSPQPGAYELDYLIAPELGGAGDIRNFWPQPYSAAGWNSHLKDALEERLHEMVCSGQISLTTAQHDIASNWVTAYKKYFRTGAPLPDHYAFAKDMPWDQ
jgi:hypothetical protein